MPAIKPTAFGACYGARLGVQYASLLARLVAHCVHAHAHADDVQIETCRVCRGLADPLLRRAAELDTHDQAEAWKKDHPDEWREVQAAYDRFTDDAPAAAGNPAAEPPALEVKEGEIPLSPSSKISFRPLAVPGVPTVATASVPAPPRSSAAVPPSENAAEPAPPAAPGGDAYVDTIAKLLRGEALTIAPTSPQKGN